MTTYLKKAAMLRAPGYPVGHSAPLTLRCPCGRYPATSGSPADVVECLCGRRFTGTGWVLDPLPTPHPTGPDGARDPLAPPFFICTECGRESELDSACDRCGAEYCRDCGNVLHLLSGQPYCPGCRASMWED